MSRPFDPLRERLLRAGIAPRYVHRYLTELSEHFEDLTATFVQSGLPKSEAEARSHARLGNLEDLAQAMIRRRDLRSWHARAPWATLVLAPSLILAAGVAGCILLLVAIRHYGAGSGGLTEAITALSNLILPILCGWSIAAIAVRQRLQPVWPTVALIIVALLGSMVHLGAHNLTVGIGMPPDMRFALNLLLTLSPYLVWRRWLMPALDDSR
ncbi:hypothetical protein C5748_20130 [Phyllobacterium phragmitis]|uniref:Uncharacterized protein n=1 Tax=Phyllobacterium phragmitis TaxID=2670329 RepID=A0A2S9IML4_9HYPH|nr:hypothetical protein [Phyllobacterium phragmitis]PRD41768.1 hypothetical protein C5748_20130 [Phyllobacterium phragmitis]